MSDYTKVYDGAALDSAEATLAGADFDVDFAAIETAVATKTDKVSGHTTNAVGLLDVNGNLISSEVLIDTDGTLAGNSDSSIPTEKAVKTYVDANTPTHGQVLLETVLNIGDWNMVLDTSKSVTHGLTMTNIRAVQCIIRNDNDTTYYDLNYDNGGGDINTAGGIIIYPTTISLNRLTSSQFDSTAFNATSYNRGWVVVRHTA